MQVRYGGAYSGTWRSLESDGRFCVGAFGRTLTSVASKMFSHLIYFVNKYYKNYTLNVICKNNGTIYTHIITHQRKEGSFPSILTGHAKGFISEFGAY
jgi:hypothetical protein